MRRVVTGVNESGTSIFVSDEEIEPIRAPVMGGAESLVLWGSDATPTVPTNGDLADGLTFFPQGPGGFRFHVFRYPPRSAVPAPPTDVAAALVETERLLPGITDAVADESGMHYSATIDLEFVVEGEFYLELDNGVGRTLRAGDSLVQCGARHAWYNRSDQWATMVLVFIGANLDKSRFAAPGV
jgi:hypothetical protein